MKYQVVIDPPEKKGQNWRAMINKFYMGREETTTQEPAEFLRHEEAGKASVLFRNIQSAIETDLDRGSLEDRRVDRNKMAGREPGPDTPNDELDLPDGFRTDEEMLPEEEPLG